MTLIRWHRPAPAIARDLVGARDEMDRLFDSFFQSGALNGDLGATFTPAVDIEETPDAWVLRADLPGMSEKDVKVRLVGDTLTIHGERRTERSAKEGTLHRWERTSGVFERSFRLPSPPQGDSVKASHRDGVLEVRVPKAEQARVREIEVQAG
jgi:HSP20 family protein